MRRELTVEDHVAGVLAADRAVVGRTLTLVESSREDHRRKAEAVLAALLPHAGRAHRVAVSGPPGAGKSTFLEAMGGRLIDAGRRVAVLAVDPSSARSGGSILGDKTRMGRLSTDPHAFVRPSPSGGTLGGVHRRAREAITVLEAAGYDPVFVETVGVGQSEIDVAGMVDTVLLLLLPHGGDDLQGIKRGILEVADVIALNKADVDPTAAARARRELEGALRLLVPHDAPWHPAVRTCSGASGQGIDEVWDAVEAHRATLEAKGLLAARRREQRARWTWALAEDEVLRRFRTDPRVAAVAAEALREVEADRLTPGGAADRLIAAWCGEGENGDG